MDQQQAVSSQANPTSQQAPQASQSQVQTSAPSVILSTAGTTVVAPTSISSISSLPFSAHSISAQPSSAVNILAGGQHGQFQTQPQPLGPTSLLQQPAIQVIQPGQPTLHSPFQLQAIPPQTMTIFNGLAYQNPLVSYGGYQLLPGQSTMPALATSSKLSIMQKNPISISPAPTTSQLFTGGQLKGSPQLIAKPSTMPPQPAFSLFQNGGFPLQQNIINHQPATTIKGLDSKSKTLNIATIQPKPTVSAASIMHKSAPLNQTIIPQQQLLQLPSGFWTAGTGQVLGGQPVYFTQTPQHSLAPLVAQSGPNTVQVVPTAAPPQAPQIISATTSTSHIKSASVAKASPSSASSSGSTGSSKPASKQLLPKPPGITAGTQTAAKTGATDASRPMGVQQQLQHQFKQQQLQKSSPNQLPNKTPAHANLGSTVKQPAGPPHHPHQHQHQQPHPSKTLPGHQALPRPQSTATKASSSPAAPQKPSVSTGTGTSTSIGSETPRPHGASHSGSKPDIAHKPLSSTSSQRQSFGNGSAPGERPMSASTKPQAQIDRQQPQQQQQNSTRKAEKRDASTQETAEPRNSHGHEKSNGVSKRPKTEERVVVRNGIPPPPEKKPLVHVIGDFLIEESSNPFPITGDLGAADDPEPAKPEQNGLAESAVTVNGHHTPEPNVVKKNAPLPIINGDSSKCQSCHKCCPRSKLKTTKNNTRLCHSCYKKHGSSKPELALFNSVTSGLNHLSDADVTTSENNSRSSADTDRQSIESDFSDKRSRKAAIPPPKIETKPLMNGTVHKDSKSPKNASAPAANNNSGENFIPASGPDPSNWNVQDVYDFILNQTGSRAEAEKFSSQEIDGQALVLIELNHMIKAMEIKLGPALKILKRIKELTNEDN